MAVDWSQLVIGMLGGDKREQEIARRAAATGAQVRAHGFPWPEHGIPGVQHLNDPAEVLEGASLRCFPSPAFRRAARCSRRPRRRRSFRIAPCSAGMAPRAHIILGWADKNLKAHADALSIGCTNTNGTAA